METNSNHLLVYDEGWNKEPAFCEEAYILCLSLMQETGEYFIWLCKACIKLQGLDFHI